jgi:hypothetical protein
LRKPDPAPQLCEARIGLQGFQPLIRVEVFGEQVRAFREGAFERGEGFVLVAETDKIASQICSSAARLVPHVGALSTSVLAAFVALLPLSAEGMHSSPSVA